MYKEIQRVRGAKQNDGQECRKREREKNAKRHINRKQFVEIGKCIDLRTVFEESQNVE